MTKLVVSAQGVFKCGLHLCLTTRLTSSPFLRMSVNAVVTFSKLTFVIKGPAGTGLLYKVTVVALAENEAKSQNVCLVWVEICTF